MPDQSSAATEHALIQEITAPFATMPDDPLSVTADVHFPVALRGYDRIAVDAYVKQTSQLVAELQATRSPEAAIRRALERVGEQISGILQRAHDTSEQITMQSRSEAEDRLEAARQEAARITAAAEQRLKDLDADTDRIWAERRQIVDDTRELAGQLLGLTDSAADRFPAAEDTGAVTEVAQPSAEEPEHGEPGVEKTGAAEGDVPMPYDDEADLGEEAEETPGEDVEPADNAPTAVIDVRPQTAPQAESPDAAPTAVNPPPHPADHTRPRS